MLLITIASLLLALVMSVVAWRARRAERQRSAARVEALARAIRQPSGPTRSATVSGADELPLHGTTPERPGRDAAGEMFTVATQAAGTGSRWGLAFAVGAFVVASAAALVIVLGGDTAGARVALASTSERAEATRAPRELPLELTALSHVRDGRQLTVQGVVRNPATGAEMDHLSAVVALFDGDGRVLTTARAPVASSSLIPGGESPFSVTIPDAGDVARYRVSFRSDERVVPHVDKRMTP